MTAGKYAIHSDFEKIPSINIRFSRLIIGLLNVLLRLSRLRYRPAPGVSVVRQNIQGEGGHSIEVRVITPHNAKPASPALIYYHGGGFAMTFAGAHLESAERYAQETGCVTVFVCYRLAMKHPFPAGFNDAYSALAWVVSSADRLGVDPARIAVGGDSAGGAMAAGVAQRARDEKLVALCGQLLIYPVLDSRCETPSARDFVDVPLWNAVSNQRMWDMYLRHYPKHSPPPYAAPGLGDPCDLPQAYIETAEFDPLRDEALQYAKDLQAVGNAPVVNETQGTVHGYDGFGENEFAVASMQKRIEFLRKVFA